MKDKDPLSQQIRAVQGLRFTDEKAQVKLISELISHNSSSTNILVEKP